jgi:hypothetical protein
VYTFRTCTLIHTYYAQVPPCKIHYRGLCDLLLVLAVDPEVALDLCAIFPDSPWAWVSDFELEDEARRDFEVDASCEHVETVPCDVQGPFLHRRDPTAVEFEDHGLLVHSLRAVLALLLVDHTGDFDDFAELFAPVSVRR